MAPIDIWEQQIESESSVCKMLIFVAITLLLEFNNKQVLIFKLNEIIKIFISSALQRRGNL
jgi:hypothetical protein